MKRLALLLGGALTLSACGQLDPTRTTLGGDGINTATQGTISFTVNATSGATTTITITDANGAARVLQGNASLTLLPGTYTVTAAPYQHGGYTYAAPSRTLSVKAGETLTVSVTYAPITGAMNLTIDPNGQMQTMTVSSPVIRVTVSGPGGFSRTFSEAGTHTLEDLQPGTYTIQGPHATSSSVTVSAGHTVNAKSTVVTEGAISFTLDAAGITPNVTLHGPHGRRQTLTASGVMQLPVGEYSISAEPVSANHYTYLPTPATQAVAVHQNHLTPAGVQYAAITGAATINILAQDGVTPDATVSGPDGYTRTITTTGAHTLADLQPGAYTLTARTVSDGTYDHTATITGGSFTVAAGVTEQASASYSVSTGNLDLNVLGLPAGTNGHVTLSGPNNYSTSVNATRTISGLEAGTYTITPHDVMVNGETFRAAGSTASVTAGQTASASVAYAQATGSVTAQLSGVPAGTAPTVQVTGTGYSQLHDATQPIRNLEPGEYTLTPQDVWSDGHRFGAPARTVSVTAGGNATPGFTYAQETGSVDITVTGLSGINADVILSTGGSNYQVSASKLFKGLDPNSFSVQARTVKNGTFYYDGTPSPSSGSVTAGGTASVSVAYTQRPVKISVDKPTVTLVPGGTVTLTATVTDAVNTGASWSNATGTLASTNTFTYTAPSTEGKYTLTATSAADPSKTATVTVTVNALTVKQFGGAFNDHGTSIARDGSGNVYIAGKIQGGAGTSDVFLAKLSADGQLAWSRPIDTDLTSSLGTLFDITGVAVSNNTVWVTGNTLLETYGTHKGGSDVFVASFGTDGTLKTGYQLGTASDDYAGGLALDSQGNVYVTGTTAGIISGSKSKGLDDVFLAKLSTGQWSFAQFGTAGHDTAAAIAVGPSDQVYLAGFTDGAWGSTNAGMRDAFIAKVSINGTSTAHQFGGAANDALHGLVTDGSGNVFAVGNTMGSLSGSISAGSQDVVLAKLAANGTLTFKQVGTSGGDAAWDVALDAAGTLRVAAETTGTFSGNTSSGSRDALAMRVDTALNVLSGRQFGTGGFDSADAIALDTLNGFAFLTGSADGQFPGQTHAGANDWFFAKLKY